jgi:hypothetical protein
LEKLERRGAGAGDRHDDEWGSCANIAPGHVSDTNGMEDAMRDMTNLDRHCSLDFGQFGIERLAYVKCVMIDGVPVYVVHAADGTELMQVEGRADAFALAVEHDLEPVSVH